MARIPRYGDEGTIVTAREKVVAILFIVGIAALLVGHRPAAPDELPGTVAHVGSTIPAPIRDSAPGHGPEEADPARAAATGEN